MSTLATRLFSSRVPLPSRVGRVVLNECMYVVCTALVQCERVCSDWRSVGRKQRSKRGTQHTTQHHSHTHPIATPYHTTEMSFNIHSAGASVPIRRTIHTNGSTSTAPSSQQQPHPQRTIIKVNRQAKVVVKRPNGTPSNGNASQQREITFGSAPIVTASVSEAPRILMKKIAMKRRSGDVTTFTRTITQADMQDDESANDSVLESASKRGRSDDRSLIASRDGSFAITIPASAALSSFASASSSSPTASFAPLPTPQPLFSALKSSPFSSSLREKVSAAALQRVTAQAQKQKATTNGNSKPVTNTNTTPTPVASPTPSPPQSKKAVPSEPPTTVLIRNLAPNVQPRFIVSQLFGPFHVASITVDTDPVTHACTGTAEAIFIHSAEANEAVQLCQGQHLFGQPVRLSIIAQKDLPASEMISSAVVATSSPAVAPTQSLLLPSSSSSRPLTQQATFATSTGHASSLPLVPASTSTGPLFSAAAAAHRNGDSVLSSPGANIGFVWDGLDPSMDEGETIFNITNLRLPNPPPPSSLDSSPASMSASSIPRKKPLEVQLKNGSTLATSSSSPTTHTPTSFVTKSGISVKKR